MVLGWVTVINNNKFGVGYNQQPSITAVQQQLFSINNGSIINNSPTIINNSIFNQQSIPTMVINNVLSRFVWSVRSTINVQPSSPINNQSPSVNNNQQLTTGSNNNQRQQLPTFAFQFHCHRRHSLAQRFVTNINNQSITNHQ